MDDEGQSLARCRPGLDQLEPALDLDRPDLAHEHGRPHIFRAQFRGQCAERNGQNEARDEQDQSGAAGEEMQDDYRCRRQREHAGIGLEQQLEIRGDADPERYGEP